MEIQQIIKNQSNKPRIKTKLTVNELNDKITLAQRRLHDNTEIIKRFISDLDPHLALDFQKALKTISAQYSWISNYDVTQDDRKRVRMTNANSLISLGTVDTLVTILPSLFNPIFDLQFTDTIDKTLFNTVKQIMFVFFNYADASGVFGDEVCKHDKLLSLYHRILVSLREPCVHGNISEDFLEILRTVIATLYNTLLYDSEQNLQKIRHLKYLDIIKSFLSCNFEKIKINSLLFTAYVANEGDSMLFKSDQASIMYLLNLLSESMKMKSGRSKGLSTEELAKGIEKLSKNDENKQLLVDLGVLPILKKLMEKNSIKYKKLSLAILWSLAFDERNRAVINETFSTILCDLKTFLTTTEDDTKTNQMSRRAEMGVGVSAAYNEDIVKAKVDETIGDSKDDKGDDAQYEDIVNIALEKSKCSKVLDGLVWTLQDSQTKTLKVGSQLHETLDSRKKGDGHIMISYCWANTDVVMEIYNALKDLGYKLWIDKFNMAEQDNLMESMAKAVENSMAVITCISNGYKDSANCRAEAQYAVTKKKPLIPVMVQPKYRPDGWLGFCITGLMYCDFQGRHTFDDAMKELTKQLRRLAHPHGSEVDSTDHITEEIIPKETQIPSKTSTATTWSNSQVNSWFKTIGIVKITWNIDYAGEELSFLKYLSETSFETFIRISETKLGLTDLKDLRIFVENLKKI